MTTRLRYRICTRYPAMDSPENTATRDREQWRARILRALAELGTTPPGTHEITTSDGSSPGEGNSTDE